MDFRGFKINFLGDSITEGVGVSYPQNRYTDVFARKYGPITVRNYGISGTRIARQIHPTKDHPEWDLDFCLRVKTMDPDADLIVVFGGVNDFGHGDAPFGIETDRTPQTFIGACHTLLRTLIERYPTATVVMITPLHGTVEERPGKHPLKDYVNVIRKVAAAYSVPILDLYSESGIQPKISAQKKAYLPDGVHPNDAGAERIANRLAAFLHRL